MMVNAMQSKGEYRKRVSVVGNAICGVKIIVVALAGLLIACSSIPVTAEEAAPILISTPEGEVVMFDESIDWALSRKATDTIIRRLRRLRVSTYVP